MPSDVFGGFKTTQVQVTTGGEILQVNSHSELLEFHAEWLRERCTSSASVDQETLQPIVSPHEIAAPKINVTEVIRTGGAFNHTEWLRVEFADGHLSSFEMLPLMRRASAELSGNTAEALLQTYQAPVVQTLPWRRSDGFGVPELDYEQVVGTDQDHDWLQLEVGAHLLSRGLVIVKNVPRKVGQCVAMAKLLSTLRTTEWARPSTSSISRRQARRLAVASMSTSRSRSPATRSKTWRTRARRLACTRTIRIAIRRPTISSFTPSSTAAAKAVRTAQQEQ